MIIRPRLSDYYDVPLLQSEVDFAIPFIDEDIPLYVDPFLMWKSPSQMDNMLHLGIMQAINQLGYMYCSKEKDKAVDYLIFLSECDEVGLGTSKTRHGRQINKEQARDILELYQAVPHIQQYGLKHLEQIQLLVNSFKVYNIGCKSLKDLSVPCSHERGWC